MALRKKHPRCPRCRRHPRDYVEWWTDHSIVFEADDDGIAEREGILEDGHPYAVEAICDCGHRWKLRGVRQITAVQG